METATLTKTEEAHIERMAESFSEPTMEERFETWAGRVASHGKQERKENEKSYAPREISLKGRSDEEREFIETVGVKEEPKESRRENSAEKQPAMRTDQRSDAKETEKSAAMPREKSAANESTNSETEPLSGDQHWQMAFNSEKERSDHAAHVNSRSEVALKYISEHPQRAEIEKGIGGLFAGRQHQQEIQWDFATALAEVPNPGEVIRHIALHQGDREVLRNIKGWKELRAAVHTVSKHYAAASQPAPKPRAPKPPSEVGGRGASGDDGKEMSFANLSRQMDQQYGRHAR